MLTKYCTCHSRISSTLSLSGLFIALFIFSSAVQLKSQTAFGPLNLITESHWGDRPESPLDITSADFDGDGDQDIISAFKGNGLIALYENLGIGVYASPKEIAVLPDASCVYPADMNGDGEMDILAGAFFGSLRWYTNLGDGTFSMVPISNVEFDIHEVIAADIDGDGDTDVLTASEGMGTALYRNTGTGALAPVLILDTRETKSIKAVDLDGDGDLDILSSKTGATISTDWYENLGSGSWGPAVQVLALDGISDVADLDGDGDQDVIIANEISGIEWVENLGAGVFGSAATISTKPDATDISTADGDADGDIDIMIAHEGSIEKNIIFHENLGAGVFTPGIALQADLPGASCIAKADVNGDGDLDLIAGSEINDAIYIYRSEFDKFAPHYFIDEFLFPNHGDFADLDGDGDIDILAGTSTIDYAIFWYENENNSFGPPKLIDNISLLIREILARDLDADGDSDILAKYGDAITWYENLGDGNFSDEKIIISGTLKKFNAIETADIDNDGDLEIFTQSRESSILDDTIHWFENLGGGIFSGKQAIPTTWSVSSIFDMEIADLDRDGINDIVLAKSDQIWWIRNLGGGAYSSELIVSPYFEGGDEIEIADLDNDGYPDVLAISRYDDYVAWYRNLGDMSFGPIQTLSAFFVDGYGLETADLDNDGDLDAIVSSLHSGKTFWYKNLGGGSFSGKKLISDQTGVGAPMSIVDMNEDGYEDLMLFAIVDGVIAWFENVLRPDCDETTAPQNLNSYVGGIQVTLSWELVPGSLGCQISGGSISPPGPVKTQTFNTPELTSVSFPRSAFPDGSTWEWSVRCACETDPAIIGTPFSVTNTFSIPDARVAGADEEIFIEPNPVQDFIALQLPAGATRISISDVLGRVVYMGDISVDQAGMLNIDFANTDAGVYFLSIDTAAGETIASQFVKN